VRSRGIVARGGAAARARVDAALRVCVMCTRVSVSRASSLWSISRTVGVMPIVRRRRRGALCKVVAQLGPDDALASALTCRRMRDARAPARAPLTTSVRSLLGGLARKLYWECALTSNSEF
jgi:hypothetical protein